VTNGLEACAWLSEGNQVDLIISDINMPHMDGIELLENFKVSGLYKTIPVIILSGVSDSHIKRKCEGLGALAYLVKPFDPGKLLREVSYPFESKIFT
jgi:CheY-like chemotaxis protein